MKNSVKFWNNKNNIMGSTIWKDCVMLLSMKDTVSTCTTILWHNRAEIICHLITGSRIFKYLYSLYSMIDIMEEPSFHVFAYICVPETWVAGLGGVLDAMVQLHLYHHHNRHWFMWCIHFNQERIKLTWAWSALIMHQCRTSQPPTTVTVVVASKCFFALSAVVMQER